MAEPAREFLDSAYRTLGYEDGVLLDAAAHPGSGPEAKSRWVEIGDWLTLAHRMGADKVFFVGTEPVLVFREVSEPVTEMRIREVYRQAWCMSGPQCLFLALPGELRVYALTEPPVRWPVETRVVEPIQIVQRVADVAEALRDFSREEVESGRLFGDSRFGDSVTRADRRLVQDLRIIRRSLLARNVRLEHAHALIGRSIFIRYLEDRQVLTPAYFEKIAQQNPDWMDLLSQAPERPEVAPTLRMRLYDRVLRSHEFTYALFDQLARDFNGDMFPRDDSEREGITADDLEHLRRFLLGDIDTQQPSLFFWAYDFGIIPISLISSIYEEFYRTTDDADDNTHYTPSTLVDDVLSRVLTPERLASCPRVLDPACGSGIFLVEAFRRIVRYETQRRGALAPDDLRAILRAQIAGIELNPEAARVAAFSLYLALLNYQEPPEILKSAPLPHLVYSGIRDEQHYAILFASNAFALTPSERDVLQAKLLARKRFSGRVISERLVGSSGAPLPLECGEFDVVVGNPPWLEAGNNSKEGSDTIAIANEHAVMWAQAFAFPIGDRSYSQLFIHRALSFLKSNGTAGLLVSAKVIWNQRETSVAFRRYWLEHAHVREVVNFTHARRVFFDHAIAPFIFVRFEPRAEGEAGAFVVYWSARLTRAAQQLRSVVFTRSDRRIVHQDDLYSDDTLWKTYWWGSHLDAALIARLKMETPLRAVLHSADPEPAYGFQRSSEPPREDGKNVPRGTLKDLPELISERVTWHGPLRKSWFEGPPLAVKRQPDIRLYEGQRLLLTTGIKASFGPCVRLETAPFSFRHTMYCVPLHSLNERAAKLVLGTLWSSLGRYRLFMTSGSWGGWYDKVTAEDILGTPIRLPSTVTTEPDSRIASADRVIAAVDAIRSWVPRGMSLLEDEGDGDEGDPLLASLQAQLDQAVFDLFDLSGLDRGLITDFFNHAFDLLNRGPESAALDPLAGLMPFAQGTLADLDRTEALTPNITSYLRAFLELWNPEIEPEGEFRWQVIAPRNRSVLAVMFETQAQGEAIEERDLGHDSEMLWVKALERCAAALRHPLSEHVYIDQIVRVVTETSITILKRNERRLWNASAAREDAHATLVQAMQLPQTAELL
ncbi:Eco57I restriction-modification methylase domain-containing protein [Longimicrobium sp.]|uniref:Eco57I restriction-modification methylase domain-containing protein n=1 Tax=Longimicrobium sp. TaxID=2029185 RepID=UPI003B3A4266